VADVKEHQAVKYLDPVKERRSWWEEVNQ